MGKGKAISQFDAIMIFQTYQAEGMEVALRLCLRFGHKKSTCYKVIRSRGIVPPLRGHSSPLWGKYRISQAISYIENVNRAATLDEIIQYCTATHHFPKISIPTLWRYLDGELISLKDSSLQNQKRNFGTTKADRNDYIQWFMLNQHRTFLFIDEFGFNLNTIRKQGRSKIGQRAIITVAQNQGTNKSVVACVEKNSGIIYWDSKIGAMDSEDFSTFLSSMIDVLLPLGFINITLVFDNCRIHKEDEIDQVCSFAGWEYVFLPAYSPMLNIIEEVFSQVKGSIKAQMSGLLQGRRLHIASLPWGQKTAARQTLLDFALQIGMSVVTPANTLNYWNHMMTFVPSILAFQDV